MASVQERLQIKRVPIDKWSTREQLCLASAVGRSGDQNWMSVSRALKSFGDPNRPADWFSQKNCAAQYGSLLENVETPKRKKRTSSAGQEGAVETPGESILRKLTHERIQDLKSVLEAERKEYLKLKEEIDALESNKTTDNQIEDWRKQLEEEEKKKDTDTAAHAIWLKEREQRKQEVERAWRPMIKLPVPTLVGQKRKASESIDSMSNSDLESSMSEMDAQEPAKPALSPLLTSLLKSPSQASSAASSILHSAITATSRPSPTIASLLNSSTNVAVSPGLQQLVTTAIGQEPAISSSTVTPPSSSAAVVAAAAASGATSSGSTPVTGVTTNEDIHGAHSYSENSESVTEVTEKSSNNDDVMSETTTMDLNLPTPASETNVQSECDEDSSGGAHGNGSSATANNEHAGTPDILDSAGGVSSIEGADNSSAAGTPGGGGGAAEDSKSKDSSSSPTNTDSMFAENDEEASTASSSSASVPAPLTTTAAAASASSATAAAAAKKNDESAGGAGTSTAAAAAFAAATAADTAGSSCSGSVGGGPVLDIKHAKESTMQSGSVEIVEVNDFEDSDKEYHSPNEITPDSVHAHAHRVHATAAAGDDKSHLACASEESSTPPPTMHKGTDTDTTADDSERETSEKSPPEVLDAADENKEHGSGTKESSDIDLSESSGRRATFSPEYTEAFFDDVAIEVTKLDKSGRAKRDYSRTSKKKEEKDMLLAAEKPIGGGGSGSQLDDADLGLGGDDTNSEKEFGESTSGSVGSVSGGLIESSLLSPSSKKSGGGGAGGDAFGGKLGGFGKDRSNSPGTEDEGRRRRRYSTPATPVDSVPNSPASSIIADDDRDYMNWKKSALIIYNRLTQNKHAGLFLKPITDDHAKGYHNVVYQPMDLQTIRKNIDCGRIRTTSEFRRDVLLMFGNAVMYNKIGSQVHGAARQMRHESLEQLQMFVQVQKEGEAPGRRETRTSEPGLKRKRAAADDGTAAPTATGYFFGMATTPSGGGASSSSFATGGGGAPARGKKRKEELT